MAQKKHVSLQDLPRVRWIGASLQPGVEVQFTVERLGESYRRLCCRLEVSNGGRPEVLTLQSDRKYDIESLGKDYLNLEGEDKEAVVIGMHFESIVAELLEGDDQGIKLSVSLPGGPIVFKAVTGRAAARDWLASAQPLQAA